MLNKTIINFKNITEIGVDKIPANSVVHIDNSDGNQLSKFIIVKDVSMLTSTSTVQDLLNLGIYSTIGTDLFTPYSGNFVATEGQTSVATNGYIVGRISVIINGIILNSNQFTATDKSTITFVYPLNNKDIVEYNAY